MRAVAFFSSGRNERKRRLTYVNNLFYGARTTKYLPYVAMECPLASLANGATIFEGKAEEKLSRLRTELAPLASRYDVVVANPPYMGGSNMNRWLNAWTKKNYKETCRDLCTCFVRRGMELARMGGYEALITSDTCMYISSFEKMRKMVIDETTIVAFIDTRGTNAHPDVFDANAGWVLWMGKAERMEGAYFKLSQPIVEKEARYLEALADPGCGWFYRRNANVFTKIPGSPLAYWLANASYDAFANGKPLAKHLELKTGLVTGENDLFARLWWEVEVRRSAIHESAEDGSTTHAKKWFPMQKGGQLRRWYGNNAYLVDWENDGYRLKNHGVRSTSIRNTQYFFREGFAWTEVSSGKLGMRYVQKGQIPNVSGPMGYFKETPWYLLALLNTSVAMTFLEVLAPTLHFSEGPLGQVPVITVDTNLKSQIRAITIECCEKAKDEWDTSETSWDFNRHSLL